MIGSGSKSLFTALLFVLSFAAILSGATQITTTSLAGGTVGQPYSASLTVTGGSAPYTWSISGGSLPAGLSLSNAGTISGSPTSSGTFNFTVKVTGSGKGGDSDTQILSLVVAPALTISTSSLPAGQASVAYSQTLQASGGTAPYTWSISAGALPSGLSLSAAQISGTPSTAGTANFTVKVVDANSVSITQALSITVAPPPVTITTASLPNGQVGVSYSQTVQASGGTGNYTWSISSGSLPAGLSLGASGQITGNPTTSGNTSFTVKATDGGSGSATRVLSINIAAAPVSITTTSLLSGEAGIPYSQTLQATGGTGSYTWSVTSGTLPLGLTLNSSGRISGTPSAASTASFSVKVSDSAAGSSTAALAMTIAPALTSAACPMATGVVGQAYSAMLSASGGTPPYAWTISSGLLPQGLALNSASGQISGTPSVVGSFSFVIRVSDQVSASAVLGCTVMISAAVPALTISTASLPDGVSGVTYSQTLSATGGQLPYTWSISAGALPSGLNLSAAQISGTPSTTGTANFTVKLVDANSASVTRALSITVSLAPVDITTASLLNGQVGVSYAQTLQASGGTGSYTWSIISGSLPAGLSLSASGQITGNPTTSGNANFTVKALDTGSGSATRALSINIAAAPLTISTVSFPNSVIGSSYGQALSATGGQPPYTWNVSGGALPAGLSLNGGQVNGTPTTSGTFQFSVRLSDSAGTTATKNFAIQVSAALTIVTSSLTSLKTGVAAAQQLSAAGGVPPYLWSLVSGGLPPGLTLSPSGSISGTPTSQGTFTFTVRVTDSAAVSAQLTFTLVITTSLGISTCPVSNATQGQSYASSAVAIGGQPPYTWTLASGTLPAGVLFNGSSGGLSGIPTDSGTYPYTLLITDQGGNTSTRDCQLAVTSSLVIGTVVLPDAPQSSPYAQSLSASGGKSPYTWSIVTGNLPTGLTLSSAGTISGVAIPVGSFSFTVSVTDGNAASVQRALSLRVVSGLSVISCSGTVSEVGLVFNSPVLAVGGSPPYTWSVSAGSLPPGLTIDPGSGAISGTPLQPGSIQFTADVRDSTNHEATRQCSMDVEAAVAISTASFSTGSSSSSYSDSIVVSGGVPPFVWATTAGALPPGLSLNPTSGHITGTPLVVGTFAFTAKVIDGMGGQATKDLSIIIAQGLTIPDCPSPAAVIGLSYSALLNAVGGNLPYQWRVDSGALPPGLVLSSEQAVISGTPLQSGLFAYVLRVDDATAKSTTRLCSIQVNPPGLTITSPSSLPSGIVGTAYSQTLTATGGRAPYSWSITTAGAPSGISLDATGVLAGLPGAAGTFSFTVQVTDQDNSVVRQIVTLVMLAGNPPTITITGLPDIVDPAQQPTFALELDSGYPAAIAGTLTLVFTPDPAVGIDDPAVQFAAGGRLLTFTVPPDSTQVTWSAPVVAFQSGTVAGNIELDVNLESNGTDITPPASSRTIRVDRLAPRIVGVQVVQTSSGFDVHLTGFATTREVTQGTFQFSGNTAGATANIIVPLGDSSKIWFQSADSDTFGGQFGLVQSFQWQGQPSSVLNSVSVSLTNAQGSSAAVQAQF
jgi:hypothetical protein